MSAMSVYALPDYAELHALSNFSFQRGASHAQELAERASELGYKALAVTDECSVAGVVRAHEVAKALGLKLLPGAEFLVQAAYAFRLVVLPHNAAGWGNLCEFITEARKAGDVLEKGSYRVALGETDFSRLGDCEILLSPLPDAIDVQALGAHCRLGHGPVRRQRLAGRRAAAGPGRRAAPAAVAGGGGAHRHTPGGGRQRADAQALAQAAARRDDGRQAGQDRA
jgi:hypothetical protein